MGGFDEIFNERCDQYGRCPSTSTGGEQVEGPGLAQEGLGIEWGLPIAGRDRVEDTGSARVPRATPYQMESRVLGPASIIVPSESAHPAFASEWLMRIATASAAAAGSRVHRNRSAGFRASNAVAWRRQGRRCCWSATMPSSSPWAPVACSAC